MEGNAESSSATDRSRRLADSVPRTAEPNAHAYSDADAMRNWDAHPAAYVDAHRNSNSGADDHTHAEPDADAERYSGTDPNRNESAAQAGLADSRTLSGSRGG